MKYSKGKISIPNVTGNIVITVQTASSAPAENLSDPSQWVSGRRIKSSGSLATGSAAYLTNAIPVAPGDVIRIKNCGTLSNCFASVLISESTDVNTTGTFHNHSTDGDVFVIQITTSGYFRQAMLISELNTESLRNAVIITKNEVIN